MNDDYLDQLTAIVSQLEAISYMLPADAVRALGSILSADDDSITRRLRAVRQLAARELVTEAGDQRTAAAAVGISEAAFGRLLNNVTRNP